MPLGVRLEVVGLQGLAIEAHPAGVSHVHHQPEAGARQSVECLQQAVDGGQVGLPASLYQAVGKAEHRSLGSRLMDQRAMSLGPLGEGRLDTAMGLQFFGARQKLGHGRRLRGRPGSSLEP